jgi:hypothetical protein
MKIAIFLFAVVISMTASLTKASADEIDEAIHVVVTFCLSGGSMQDIQTEFSPEGGKAEAVAGNGKVTVDNHEAIGFVNGLNSAMTQLNADQANAARACMMPYINVVLAMIRQIADTPVKPARNPKLAGISVQYYAKTADGTRVTDALRRSGVPFTQLASVLPDNLVSNAIQCGKGTPIAAIKALATILTDAGIPVRAIRGIKSNATNVLYVIAAEHPGGQLVMSRPLSRSQIDQLSYCPSTDQDEISNSVTFKMPRPTGSSEDTRFVDAWYDSNELRGAADAANLFCKQRGYPGNSDFSIQRIDTQGVDAISLGNRGRCRGTCAVFTSISCEAL